MSLGQITGIPFIELASRNEQAKQNREAYAGLSPATSSFDRFLVQAESRAIRSDEGGNSALPLSKEALIDFLRDQQTEMNLRLLDSLIGREENRESVTGALETSAAGAMRRTVVNEASKYRQEDSKNDAPALPQELAPIICRASEKYGVDRGLIRAVIKAESNFQPRSTSPKGAMGLMQLMPETAREVGVKDPYDPFENIMGGTTVPQGAAESISG